MDTFWTTGGVARLLGTSPPRVIRAADRLFPAGRRHGDHRRFTRAQVERLAAELGVVRQRLPGLRREDMFVLAALLRRPLGLRSSRAVATAAGVSPTTASRALARLEAARLVRRTSTWVVEGRPRRIEPWRIDQLSPAWIPVAPAVREVVLPVGAVAPPDDRVPRRLWHLFWNADPSRLSIARDGRYIAGRILQSDDPEGVAWAARVLAPDDLRAASRIRGLDGERRALAANIAATR